MLSKVNSIALRGLDGYLVEVQVDISSGIPCWEIVGLPDISVREAKERVRAAIKNSNFEFKSRKIVVNLAPADLRKEGTYFDLPIAIGILLNMGYISNVSNEIAFVGELSLDGGINKVNGILPICIEAKKLGIKKIVLPKENREEGAFVEGMEIIAVKNIKEVVGYLNGKINIKVENKESKNFNNYTTKLDLDFSDVKGQENVKRALEISAAGGHNCILIRKSRCWKNNVSKTISKYITRYKF